MSTTTKIGNPEPAQVAVPRPEIPAGPVAPRTGRRGTTQEDARLAESRARRVHWKRWGPYLSERQWGTVREDYSPRGEAWESFPHDHARSRAYRWGEDGLAGICDRHGLVCFALALWNGRDPILKERAFGLTNHEGNHGEDLKEYYFYLDSTPTHSYMKYLYKYPQVEFPYGQLIAENARRTRQDPEFELMDTGVFDENRYFDVFVEYAKATSEDLLIQITVENRGPEAAELDLLPTLWFRNTWSWGGKDAAPEARPSLRARGTVPGEAGSMAIEAHHPQYGTRYLIGEQPAAVLFTENESNATRLWGVPNRTPYVKDGINDYLVRGARGAVNPALLGTKAAAHYRLRIPGGGRARVKLRFTDRPPVAGMLGTEFDRVLSQRLTEADEFFAALASSGLSPDARNVQRQALAGLLWSKQFYHYDVRRWLDGDPGQPPPPPERRYVRNREWEHLYNADVISMPDKWEYPWYAAWDLAFHAIALAVVDPDFAKDQLILLLREWYMHPNGQLPAYEWELSDANPPVHAWAALRVYQIDRRLHGKGDRAFLEKVFHKLLLNFTWWVNRKDAEGLNVFQGGFLGMDNIGVFDRSMPLPAGGRLEQSDATSWMGMYCLNMLAIAGELAREDPAYEDVASKFFEHFAHIAHAINHLGPDGSALWDDEEGFFYDAILLPNGVRHRIKIRSMVGLVPLFAVQAIEPEVIDQYPGFKRRMQWFIDNEPEFSDHIEMSQTTPHGTRWLLSIVNRAQLLRVLKVMLDEHEFLSPHGIRSVSQFHRNHPFVLPIDGTEHRVAYDPAESPSGNFGGNSNWRGPIWLPMNYLLIESLQRFHHYFGDSVQVEFPTGSGKLQNLWEVAAELSRRLSHLFLRDADGRRPMAGGVERLQSDPHWRDLLLFHEYFHGDHGAGLGANHQTGWTGLVAKLIEQSGE